MPPRPVRELLDSLRGLAPRRCYLVDCLLASTELEGRLRPAERP